MSVPLDSGVSVVRREDIWPLFGIRITTPRLTMRPPDDRDLVELADLSVHGIHDPRHLPFTEPWSVLPSPYRQRAVMLMHWRNRANWHPDDWRLSLVLEHDEKIIGCYQIYGQKFRVRRVINTSSSWIGTAFQGQGLAQEARAGIAALAFRHLGARLSLAGVFAENQASISSIVASGYEPNGINIDEADGQPEDVSIFKMTRERWGNVLRDKYPVRVEGIEAVRDFFISPAMARTGPVMGIAGFTAPGGSAAPGGTVG